MNTKNRDIRFGNIEFDESEFDSKHVKVRITTMIDEDILTNLKKHAESKGQKYQTLLNQVLRAFTESSLATSNTKKDKSVASINEGRVRQIVREELRKRA
jgi:predicted DNA binding CopG/RHH family protein